MNVTGSTKYNTRYEIVLAKGKRDTYAYIGCIIQHTASIAVPVIYYGHHYGTTGPPDRSTGPYELDSLTPAIR